ncbi:mediator of RNA polymerase II transcription subunit 9-like [Pomacea canaliculata]|uniref:mediator of RNA polymerase II transcription subunit 9-like n=1 Tax=Pomacea canaliculata TaxID=400727 RepID=UPI000D73DB9F|nr:mediator of RNA polymerase II transcription subunit 9-like [Pomacea canaliculata]
MASSSPAENELNLLPAVYDVIRSIEKESPDLNQVNQKLNELKTQFQKARECAEKLPGVQYSKEEQLKRVAVLHKQLELKTKLLQKYKSKGSFDISK